jgi:hypothetical protein
MEGWPVPAKPIKDDTHIASVGDFRAGILVWHLLLRQRLELSKDI